MDNKRAACRRGRVIIAMSGGVDSSVAAAMLKNDLSALGGGYNVVGIFMLMHKNSNPQDAKIVAKKLKIDFKVLDVRKEFKKQVIDYTLKEYESGNTPNPCVECNKYIKFRFLLEKMVQLKADFIATGHYARIKDGKLFIAKDIKKDQSYFLWTLKQKQLTKILFPLGDYTKEQVRGLAKNLPAGRQGFKLPVFNKKESQDICFDLPRPSSCVADPIITMDNKKIGEHKGLIFYTIGQRKNIGLSGGPYYVVKKDYKKNTLIVSKSKKDLLQKGMAVKNMNWISGKPYTGKCKVKIRSMAKMADAIIKGSKIVFKKPQRAITSGQSAVFYLDGELMGGGVIL
ncbi:MAG TPA: tRNA 2-thiouridine(34) synthase MnmA [Candidatus Paceibacterota bacterium]|nr:tRNA 2-thiouridine(34) synthase MnmA [Candidatus Paceibacterota bacterium]